jgi:predicted RNase H-like HicB family nuclease
MSEVIKTPKEYLKLPYSRILTPDEETGTYAAEIREFSGCVAQGDTAEEAYRNLEAAAESWIEVALDMGQEIPEPSSDGGYSGRIALRLPKTLHQIAARMAERDGTSLNQFLVAAIAERVGAGKLYVQLAQTFEVHAAALERKAYEAGLHTANEVSARHYPSVAAPVTGGLIGSPFIARSRQQYGPGEGIVLWPADPQSVNPMREINS